MSRLGQTVRIRGVGAASPLAITQMQLSALAPDVPAGGNLLLTLDAVNSEEGFGWLQANATNGIDVLRPAIYAVEAHVQVEGLTPGMGFGRQVEGAGTSILWYGPVADNGSGGGEAIFTGIGLMPVYTPDTFVVTLSNSDPINDAQIGAVLFTMYLVGFLPSEGS